MAFLQFSYKSDALGMSVAVNVILPESVKNGTAESYKTLYLLHGLSDDHSTWMRMTSIERYAQERGIAVVMPSVGRNWYTDVESTGRLYMQYVADELPRVCRNYFRGMSDKREDNFIAGLSMGGYGAAKIALTYPERFAGFATLSGAIDVAYCDRGYLAREFNAIFGEGAEKPERLRGTKHDPIHLVRELAASGRPMPRIFVWCGTEDGLIESNRMFRSVLSEEGIEHHYSESDGDHSWRWWDMHIKRAIEYLMA